MARPYRLQAEDTLYHIICRGNDRNRIFLNDSDYDKYLNNLEKAIEKYDFYLYSYVLMTNHVHLLLETSQPNIARIMHTINSSYTTYFNLKHKKCGHLFQGRYKSIIVDKDEYLRELTRYIHLNPVRAKIVAKAEDYPWSSYHEYIKRDVKKALIARKRLGKYLDLNPNDYRSFVQAGVDEDTDFKNKLYAGFILGGERFIKRTLGELKEQVNTQEISYAGDINHRYDMDEIVKRYCSVQGFVPEELCGAKKKKIAGRKEAIYLLKQLTSLGNVEIGERFGVSYSRVSKATRDVEGNMGKDKRYRERIERILSQVKG